jgi:hypothetical protein
LATKVTAVSARREAKRLLRVSSDNPRLKAFCRVAPSVLFKDLAIEDAGIFFLASAFNVRMCSALHARLFVRFCAIFMVPDFVRPTSRSDLAWQRSRMIHFARRAMPMGLQL